MVRMSGSPLIHVFFFQAEDGIRDYKVTGVQTCALPISLSGPAGQQFNRDRNNFFKAEGVAAVLRDSGKNHSLLNMTSIGGGDYEVGAPPPAFFTPRKHPPIWRFLKRGPPGIEHPINTFLR